MNIDLYSIHGLVCGNRNELGCDPDTGGQVRYVIEMARSLSQRADVNSVRLFTRKIVDRKLSNDYSVDVEALTPKAQIVRLPCGPDGYIRKEKLWPYLSEFAVRAIEYSQRSGIRPHTVHGHYVDAGIVAKQVAEHFQVPFVFTGHSLGKPKLAMLLEQGQSREAANRLFAIDHRIAQEQVVLESCDMVVASTQHEAQIQYGDYPLGDITKIVVLAPGTDLKRFFAHDVPNHSNPNTNRFSLTEYPNEKLKWNSVRRGLRQELGRFLNDPTRQMILSVCRPVERKNLASLVTMYGESEELRKLANLVIISGNREDLRELPADERAVFTDLVMLMDRYDLYGKMAIPKHHDSDTDVPELMRMAACGHGVFVNPAHFELFGLTSIEAAATGLPFVATNNGGPVDVAAQTQAGFVVDVSNRRQFSAAIKLLLTDQVLWQRMSMAGIRSVRQHYAWERHCEKYIRSIRELIASRGTRAVPTSANKVRHRRQKVFSVTSRLLTKLGFPVNNHPLQLDL